MIIHNNRLTLPKPSYNLAGDYICKALAPETHEIDQNELAIVKVRTQPYIREFGVEMSHTGASTTKLDGERLELDCSVPIEYGKVNITWLRSKVPDDESHMIQISELPAGGNHHSQIGYSEPNTFNIRDERSVIVESLESQGKRLIIDSVRHEHRGYYICLADNGVTERSKKVVYLRVKDRLAALWPFLGIVAEVFILLTIIQIWETQRAYRELNNPGMDTSARVGAGKRQASGLTVPIESVPLTHGVM